MNKILEKTTTFLVAICLIPGGASAWSPAGNRIKTRWASDVTPENVWQSYPRPSLKRTEWMNLNGLWSYSVTDQETSMKAVPFDGEILVPFCIESSLSGVGKPFLPTDKLWYQRTFTLDRSWKGKNILLHFGSVDYRCTVYVDGKEVGRHTGGNTPFAFDITSALKGNGTHILVVAVTDPTDTESDTRGKQILNPHGIWYTAVSGIWKTVWLEPVSKTRIARILPVPDIKTGTVKLGLELVGATGKEVVDVSVLDNGKKIASFSGTLSEAAVRIPDPVLWTPGTPKLYELSITLKSKGKIVDVVSSYTSLREVSIVRDACGYKRIALNGGPVFQFGTLDQGWWPDGLLTPPSEEAMLFDMVELKKMGFNTIRKHIKVEPELYYHYADSLGIMIWQDMVSGFNTSRKSEQHVGSGSKKDWDAPIEHEMQWKKEYSEMVSTLAFYPSITTWVVFNEGWGQFRTKEMTDFARAIDGTRIINSVTGWADRGVGDLCDAHNYPSVSMILPEENGDRIAVLGEFGGLSLPVGGHTWQTEGNWGYRRYENNMDLIRNFSRLLYDLESAIPQGLAAAIYTQTTDVETELNGLITYDRAVVKMPEDVLHYSIARLYKANSAKPVTLVAAPAADTESPVHPESSFTSEADFTLQADWPNFSLWIRWGDVAKVWINGVQVFDAPVSGTRFGGQYNLTDFSDALVRGRNCIKVEARNGGRNPMNLNYRLVAF